MLLCAIAVLFCGAIGNERRLSWSKWPAPGYEMGDILYVPIATATRHWWQQEQLLLWYVSALSRQLEPVYSIVFEIRPYYGRIAVRIVVLLAFAVRIRLIQYSDRTYQLLEYGRIW